MSVIGNPIDTSLLQAAQQQQQSSKSKDRERATIHDRARRYQDMVELRVAGVEAAEAVRKLPSTESEQGEQEQRRRALPILNQANASHNDDDAAAERPHIDVTA